MTKKVITIGHPSRREVKEALDQSKEISVIKKTFYNGRLSARVLIAGKYYDVKEGELALLVKGWTPDDLQLTQIPEKGAGN